jgi:hypothetical protein
MFLFIPCQPSVELLFSHLAKLVCLCYDFRLVHCGSLQTEILLRSQCGQSFAIIHVFKNIGFSFLPGLSFPEQCV